ncbi:MAG: AAA family ATPase, partial [bacterium]|nr:AAA family ATPase [bacterium]
MDLQSIQFRNFLSFRDPPPLELRRLNVLIGPNGSGKSNLVEGLGLLQAAPRDFGNALRIGGPV